MTTSIDFSAQFGGRDAAQLILPHFKALKAAARETVLLGFPFPKLAFILRVDGEVNSYGISGAANVDIEKSGAYVSVDIGITSDDRNCLGHEVANNVFVQRIMEAARLLVLSDDKRLMSTEIDQSALYDSVHTLCKKYLGLISSGDV